ncbi:MAG: hypothetical protein HQL47_07800 [Gammaproteobacteria bacterium]|nr:hypothetical protein [Gammaproteobacteria bacterium]
MIAEIMQGFEPKYREVLAAAFSESLQRAVGPDELRDYPIGKVTLSQRLYQEADATAAVVQRIVSRHAQGYQQARDLALQIYQGYGFRPEEALKWPARSPKWPKYMREAVTTDPVAFPQYKRIARRMAGNLKTPALRAAYLEALSELEAGPGAKRLAKRLDVAFEERMRYHANRIAQTELHRQWAEDQAREILADDSISAVQWELSASHPVEDICDLYAYQDAYGLGPGIYPKEQAPIPTAHPFCRCRLISKRLIDGSQGKENAKAQKAFLAKVLREQGPRKAARIAGSRQKLEQVLKGAKVEDLVNPYRPAPYQLGQTTGNATIGQMQKSAYEMALDVAGPHHGWLEKQRKLKTVTLEKSIRTLNRTIAKHEEWIANPYIKFPTDAETANVRYHQLKKWPDDIRRQKEQINIIEGVINERTDKE